MQYLLTQEEKDDLGGNEKKMRAEFRARLDDKLGEFSREITIQLKAVGYNAAVSYRQNPELETFVRAIKAAMDKCELAEESQTNESV